MLEMSVKNRPGATAQATFSTSGAPPALVIRAPATAGIVDLAVPFTTMQGLSAGNYFWDLLRIAGSTSHIFLGGGTWLITQGITESATPALPAASPFVQAAGADIALTLGNASLMLTLAPGGPPGTGTSFAPQEPPLPPTEGWQMFCDATDNDELKAIYADGAIRRLAIPDD
jgi:hypothetical protein